MDTKELITKLRGISNAHSASDYKRMICKMAAQKLERLTAYEDSGLEPEGVQELASAKKEGRLVVLPCKVGDRVFSGYGNPLDISVSKTNGDCVTHVKISRRGYLFKCWWGCFRISDIGKTVFLTRAEAEAALEAQKGGGGKMDKLKPCPVCGSADCHTKRHYNRYDEVWWGVKCYKCGFEKVSKQYDLPIDAMDAWGWRAEE